MRRLLIAIFLTLFIPTLAFTQSQQKNDLVESEDNESRAHEILKKARESLGGEANLSAIKSLQIKGNYKEVMRGRDFQGDLLIEVLLPDKFLSTARISKGSVEVTKLEVINGEQAWTDMKPASAPAMGTPAMASPFEATVTPEAKAAQEREARADFNRFLVAVLLAPGSSSPFIYSFEREMETKEGKVDLLSVTGPDGFAVLLLVDQKSHHPWMITYRAPAARGSSSQAGEQDETGEPKTINYQVFFTDLKQVGNVWLPHRIVKSSEGRTIEEWKVSKYKLNPEIKANRFEKKK